ncbi:MAG: hypothetical protein R3C28_15915 [Pirellulaceae bacterium]
MDSHIPVVCPVCHTRMHAERNQVGQSIICPDCETVTKVPRPIERPKKATPKLDDGYQLQGSADDVAVANVDSHVKLTCVQCHALLTVLASHAGKQVRCPKCKALNRIPRPRSATAKSLATQSVGSFATNSVEQESAFPRGDARTEIANRMLQNARRELDQADEDTRAAGFIVDDTDRLAGFASFLMQAEVITTLLVIAIGSAISMGLLMLLNQAMAMISIGSIMAVFLCLFAALAAIMTAGLSAPVLLAIIETTANGGSKIEHVKYDLGDRGSSVFLFANAYAIACIPWALIGMAVDQVVETPTIIVMALGFLTFPIVLMSFLHSGSCFTPLSAEVLRSINKRLVPWLVFVVSTVLMAASIGALLMFSPLIAAPLIALFTVYYSRQFGKLFYNLPVLVADGDEQERHN